jgi:2-hydroxychromene-2-carboxylate isomerase
MSHIEYFYSTHSAFAYLGSARLADIARSAGRSIAHKPIDLRPVIQAARGDGFAGFSAAHRAYFFEREIDRWSEYRDAPTITHRPTHHDNDLTLSSGMIIAAVDIGQNADALAHAILEAHWRHDADHADPDALETIASEAGYDATRASHGYRQRSRPIPRRQLRAPCSAHPHMSSTAICSTGKTGWNTSSGRSENRFNIVGRADRLP